MKKQILLFSILFMLMLTACGKTEIDNDKNEESIFAINQNDSSFTAEDELKEALDEVLQSEEDTDTLSIYSFSDYIDKNVKSVWFYIEDGPYKPQFGKDTEVSSVYVFENNTIVEYSCRGKKLTLGMAARMTDDEVIETVSTSENMQPQEFCINLYTDETGNRVYQESICWFTEYQEERYKPPYGAVYKLTGAYGNYEVYDVVYSGYRGDSDYNNAAWFGNHTKFFFVTKIDTDEMQEFCLDSLETEGALIDPTDEEVLIHLIE